MGKFYLQSLYVKGEACPKTTIIWKWKFLLRFQWSTMSEKISHFILMLILQVAKFKLRAKVIPVQVPKKYFFSSLKMQHHKINFEVQSTQRSKRFIAF